MNAAAWTRGNRIRLLENGEAFYPRVLEGIRRAASEVLLETFILAEDEVGKQLQSELIAAARRGVSVWVTLDGYGSHGLSYEFLKNFTDANIEVHLHDPAPALLGFRSNLFRRLHRKLVVIDGQVGFVGGLNFCDSHLRSNGADSKQDYAVEVTGPVVPQIRGVIVSTLPTGLKQHEQSQRDPWARQKGQPPHIGGGGLVEGGAAILLVTRDNTHHRNDIEHQYRLGARTARRRLTIANAYFLPSYRLLHDIARAARRGVEVRLILQGQPDVPLVGSMTTVLYDYLLKAGVRIFEFHERPFHGKVALADDEWATVGSSNLDPLSLALNLEANLVIRDSRFNDELGERLDELIRLHCREVSRSNIPIAMPFRQLLGVLAFHFLRHFPGWAGLLPGHGAEPSIEPALIPVADTYRGS